MFGFLKSKHGDEELSRECVRHVFAVGRETCPSIVEAVQMFTQGDVSFPVNDAASLDISLAILGTSLAVLKGHSQVMTADRGTHIETFCKHSIQRDYDLPSDSADKLNDTLDEYQAAFEKSMAGKNNPFGETSGMMLVRCLGPRAKALCLPGTSALRFFVHQVVGDLMTMTVTQVLTFWKGK
ncbi:MAG: hypothetical protein A3G93_16625 [Nitrospinae bacterium RIFCSPLOWO2_12_FULL_45_22]|nr:MAG: hypothetical protein A3G93_16625 [Nitrospinae bacterium RIFCSPLOWO2_12_FULL_45_22]